MFSKACEHGIKAMIFIAQQRERGERVSLKEIAREIGSPEAFTAKILQVLARENFLVSTKGPSGGFVLALPATDINLAALVKAIDGDKIFTGCALGLRECNSEKPCPVHFKFVEVRDDLHQMLSTTTLHELALGLKNGVAFLKR